MKKYFIIAVLGIVCFFGIPSHKAMALTDLDASVNTPTSVTANSAVLHGYLHSTHSYHGGFLGLSTFWSWPVTPYFILAEGRESTFIDVTSPSFHSTEYPSHAHGVPEMYMRRQPSLFRLPDVSASGPFSRTISNLFCGTSYKVDILAYTPGGEDFRSGYRIVSATRGVHPISFMTSACPTPSVALTSTTPLSVSSARLIGHVDLGDAAVVAIGFEYGPSSTFSSAGYTSSLPGSGVSTFTYEPSYNYIYAIPTSTTMAGLSGFGTAAHPFSLSLGVPTAPSNRGNFSADISSLSCGVTYHVRAWATTSGGTGYSPDTTFVTPCTAPSVRTDPTPSISGITANSVNLTGQVLSLGGSPTVSAGFVYGSTIAYGSTTSPSTVSSSTGVSALFTQPIFGLTCGQTYQYAAYVSNSAATVYGANKTFSTLACGSPAVETSLPTIASAPSPAAPWFYATFRGTLTYLGGFPSANVSFRYGPTTTYGTTIPATTPGASMGGLGAFSSNRIGLPCGTYHWQAVADGPGGIAYGIDRTFNGCASLTEDDVIRDEGSTSGTGSSGGGVLILPGSTSIDLESAIGGEIAAYFAEVFAPDPEIPEAAPELLGRASLLFLVNGGASASALPGSPVTLTWQVANIAPNSCVGTSTDPASTLWRDTAKAPLRDISPDTLETYSEVLIASEMPTVSYTMQECKGFDGSTVPPQTVTVNSTSVVETPIPAVSAPEPLVPVATPTEPTMRWFER